MAIETSEDLRAVLVGQPEMALLFAWLLGRLQPAKQEDDDAMGWAL